MSASNIEQINTFIDSGDYYSAHQKAITSSTRLLAQPRRRQPQQQPQQGSATGTQSTTWDSKSQEASEMLWHTSRKLLEKSQRGSGQELALKLVQLWQAKELPCTQQERGKVLGLSPRSTYCITETLDASYDDVHQPKSSS
jgi:hypothetical protein